MLGEFCASLCPCVYFTEKRSLSSEKSSHPSSYQNIGIPSFEIDDTHSQDSKDNEFVGETTYLRVNPKSPKSPNSPNSPSSPSSPLSLWSDDSLVIVEPDPL